MALELECNNWKWRWEPAFLGPKVSAEIISKHLIIPLISVNHLAFSSSDVLGDLAPGDLEKVCLCFVIHLSICNDLYCT